jgi:formylglycine-generating enzyme required for sulfatase activity
MKVSKILLAVALLLSQCNSANNPPKEALAPKASEKTSEDEFTRIIGKRTINFPGMQESLRKMFQIPPQSLHLPLFYMDQFEVTNEEFQEFVVAAGYRPKNLSQFLKHWKSATEFPDWAASFPVVWVSQKDAEAYCSWKGKRLPTEEEWEKAARGDSGLRFPWGDVSPTGETANFLSDASEPVGNRTGDCSPYGIFDLAGNVSELTSSAISGKSGPKTVVRGGCYKAGPSEMVTFQRRTNRGPDARAEHVGFRCVAD